MFCSDPSSLQSHAVAGTNPDVRDYHRGEITDALTNRIHTGFRLSVVACTCFIFEKHAGLNEYNFLDK
jgi:hypothetical protein